MKQPRFAPPPLALVLVAACGTGVSQPDASTVDARPSAECLEAPNHSDLEWLEENVFTPSCAAFSACHKGSALSAGGLNLEAGNVEGNLVDEPSIDFPAETLVVAGDPDASYLMVVLGSRTGDLPEAGTMPFNNPLLCKPKRDAIERWIDSLDDLPADAGVDDDAGAQDAAP